MTDREMLELAAKAYWADEIDDVVSIKWIDSDGCIEFTHGDNQDHNGRDVGVLWNPLTDDGDALRLAVTLLINVEPYEDYIFVESYSGPFANEFIKQNKGCRFLAARRAIVRVAAQIGKEME